MRSPQFTVDSFGDRPTMQIHTRGLRVLDDAQTNRGTRVHGDIRRWVFLSQP